jgi:hypothetical protein
MMPTMREYAYLAIVLFAIGCGGTEPGAGGGGDDVQTPMDAPTGNPDAYVPPSGYTKLIGRTWTLNAGDTDIYRCVRLTVPQDMYITSIEAQAPIGTHHTVLSIAGSNGTSGPDGEQDCGVSTLGMVMLYASGVGTSPLNFPPDVGIKVSAGQQIHLNLHLYNAGDDALSGESAIWVKSQPTPPPTLAEMVFAGKFIFSIDGTPQGQTPMPQTVVGGCTVNSAYSLFAVWPHMHKLATHNKVELIRNSTTTVLHDQPYNFAEQNYYLKSPIVAVQTGDQIRVTCTYLNPMTTSVGFGDSSDKEMCFSGLYRYPAKNSGLFQCTDTGGVGF